MDILDFSLSSVEFVRSGFQWQSLIYKQSSFAQPSRRTELEELPHGMPLDRKMGLLRFRFSCEGLFAYWALGLVMCE